MNPKSFVLKTIYIFTISYLMLFILYYLVNPEQKFSSSITSKKFFYTKEYSIGQFNKLKIDKHILIFGSSQSHMISTEMMKDKTLNFHNLYSEPGDILNFFKQLNNEQINNISEIIYLIDLRAGAYREDTNLINYSKKQNIEFALTINNLQRLFIDIKKNISQDYVSYLKQDGSVYHLSSANHIKFILQHYENEAVLKYTDKLINDIAEINDFAKMNKIKIKYITPVVNDKYFESINFNKLSIFYHKLINKGITNLNLNYYINGFSNIKNKKNEYLSFVDQDHLNQKFVEKWLNEYILEESEFTINSKQELDNYINYVISIQNSIKHN